MPSIVELASHAAMLGFLCLSVGYLRQAQPDPNPAIDAREAAKQSVGVAAVAGDASPAAASAVVVERREQDLPFVGTERRISELAQDAAAWRRSA